MASALAVSGLLLTGCSAGADGGRTTTSTSTPPRATSTVAPAASDWLSATVVTAAPLPVPRTEVAGGRVGSTIVVLGGFLRSGTPTGRVDFFDARSGRWSRGPDYPEPIHHVAMASLGARVWAAGGYTVRGGSKWAPVADVFSLRPGDGAWTREPSLTTPRGAAAATAIGGRLMVAGGATGGDQVARQGTLASVEELRAGERSWSPGPALPSSRQHFALTAAGDAVYAIAGRVTNLDTNLTSVVVLRDGQWRAAGALAHARSGVGAATVAGHPCAIGGEQRAGTVAAVECLVGGAWTTVASLAVPRHGLAVVAEGNEVHVVGGGPQPNLTVSGAHEVLDFARPGRRLEQVVNLTG